MGIEADNLIERLLFRRMIARWRAAARSMPTVSVKGMRTIRSRARQMRHEVDRALHLAESRLALPDSRGFSIPRAAMSDWAWRPPLWRHRVRPSGIASVETRTDLGGCLTVFHDCTLNDVTIRQVRNTRDTDLSPFGLSIDVFRFEGSFLSLVLELPKEAMTGLRLTHLIRFDLVADLEAPIEIFARLNVKHGPNTAQLVRELDLADGTASTEFDLFGAGIDERRIERAWLELIFEAPDMNRIGIRDLTVARRPRAEL